ncbi:MAG TPA: hypothetical protein VMQ51_04260, partial [Candidatus Binatia bacterium]|nr:hypothetical protein [Candidatus Binatia bacterium]
YRPDPQPRGARVSANYQVVGDRLRIELDTNGQRLEQAWLMRPGTASLAPDAVENPAVVTGPPSTISVGVGGGSSGVGTGLGVDFPIGSGSRRTRGNTIVWFPLGPAGPAPWQLYVKLAGVEATRFAVGGPLPP